MDYKMQKTSPSNESVTMKSLLVFSLLLVAAYGHTQHEAPIIRIANGQIAQSKQFPYQVQLSITKRRDGKLISSLCGGALISNRTILTAGHCLEGATSMMMFMGISKDWSKERTQVMRAAWRNQGDFVVHENYNDISLENDVALINFNPAVPFNDGVKTVNLPKPDQVNLDGIMAVVAGFGKTATNTTMNSKELRFANRKILPSPDCQRPYRSNFNPKVHVCLDGSDGIAPCPGDSGGPLVIEETDGSKTVVGLSSFGDVTCDTGFPTVFTRVTAYVNWIKKHMK